MEGEVLTTGPPGKSPGNFYLDGDIYTYVKTDQNVHLNYVGFCILVAQLVKNPPAVRETWVQSLGWEDPLEKGLATLSSILAWRILWTEETGGPQSMGSQC